MSNKREYYRIVYPEDEKPTFIHHSGRYPVVDVSEGGFSFEFSETFLMFEGEPIEGEIEFGKRGKRGKVAIEGEIIRLGIDQVSVQCMPEAGIPLPQIMEEQRHLIRQKKL